MTRLKIALFIARFIPWAVWKFYIKRRSFYIGTF
jgi:hypothetical protein